ncbi:PulJ/GspJ family protein [Solidesulfovibrio sp.]
MNRMLSQAGLTLIELVMTIVLFGLVAVMAVSFFSSGVTRTDIPITQLQADAQLQLVLENMIAYKDKTYNANSANLNGLSADIGAVGSSPSTFGSSGTYYVADNRFVCPNASNGFENSANTYQFLLVTIRSSASSGVSLSYLFSSNNESLKCTAAGS